MLRFIKSSYSQSFCKTARFVHNVAFPILICFYACPPSHIYLFCTYEYIAFPILTCLGTFYTLELKSLSSIGFS